MVRVLDEDPELARFLSGRALSAASAAAIAPVMAFDTGPVSFPIDEPTTHTHLGLLVLDGLIARHVSFGQIGATEFLGPGDVLRPWARRDQGTETAQVRWMILAPARLAALDADFASRVRAWPEVAAALADRTTRRHDAQLLQAALHQAKYVEDRVLLALWHFAGRWGQIGSQGRIVKLPHITGEILAQFVGAGRQSVSSALGKLTDRGLLRRRDDGSIVLPHEPPELAAITARGPRDRPSAAGDATADVHRQNIS